MDTMLQALLSWQFLLFCLAIAAITFVIRKIAEYALDNPKIPTGKMTKTSKLWKELILPILPVLMGPLGGFLATQYPYPDGLHTASGRLVFGLVAGLLSGLVYRVINSFLTSKLSIVEQPRDGCADADIEPLAAKVRKTIKIRETTKVRETINKE